MTASIASFRRESADSASIELERLSAAAQQESDRGLLDPIADSDKLVMERLFQDVFRFRPVTSEPERSHL